MDQQPFKNIYIPDPCHENWDKMTPVEKGRFCQGCQSKVYDFTNASIDEVMHIYKKSKGEACATFYDDQINQELKYRYAKTSWSHRIKLFIAATFATLWLKLTILSDAAAVPSSKNLFTEETVKGKEDSTGKEVRITGRVIDKSNETGVSNMRVVLKEKKKIIAATQTDGEGKFEIKISGDHLSNELFLETERSKRETRHGWMIRPSVSVQVNANSAEPVILEVEQGYKKKPFKKNRMIRTGRFRSVD